MSSKNYRAAAKQVTQLLSVFVSGMAAAAGVVLAVIYCCGPAGEYKMDNILLSPYTIRQLSFASPRSHPNAQGGLRFDKIVLVYRVPGSNEWESATVDEERYKKFYSLISGEYSILDVPRDAVNQFSSTRTAVLSLYAKPAAAEERGSSSQLFQQIDFSEGSDYFRVEIRSESRTGEWAYFKHPRIYQQALNILLPNSPRRT